MARAAIPATRGTGMPTRSSERDSKGIPSTHSSRGRPSVLKIPMIPPPEIWERSGGGLVGIDGAGGDPRYEGNWYADTLLGARFKGHPLHPQFQRATIRIEDTNDPATRDLG